MLEIALMRHGRVAIPDFNSRIVGTDFKECLNIYDQCELDKNSHPDKTTVEYFSQYQTIVCSDLKRSIESVQRLTSIEVTISDSHFAEVKNPHLHFSHLKLYPKTWAILIGVLWYLGFMEKKKPFIEAKQRAVICVDKLEALAQENGKVLLVGHGFMNTYIATELRKRGWQGPKTPAKRNWQYGIYRI